MRNRTALHSFLLLATLLILTACPKNSYREELASKAWLMESFRGEPVGLGRDRKPIYFRLNEDYNISGFAGCNSLIGRYRWVGSQVAIDSLMIASLMECPIAFSDTILMYPLQMADEVDLKDNKLLFRQGKEELATFIPKEPHMISFVDFYNTQWELVRLNNRSVRLPEDKKVRDRIYIQFPVNQQNQYKGYAGCNIISGVFAKEGPSLRFKQITDMAVECPAQELQEDFMKTLKKVDNFRMLGDQLIFQIGDRSVAIFEAVKLELANP